VIAQAGEAVSGEVIKVEVGVVPVYRMAATAAMARITPSAAVTVAEEQREGVRTSTGEMAVTEEILRLAGEREDLAVREVETGVLGEMGDVQKFGRGVGRNAD